MSHCGTPYVEKARALEFLNSQENITKLFFLLKKNNFFLLKKMFKIPGQCGLCCSITNILDDFQTHTSVVLFSC